MSCDFIKSLTAEQKNKLRKALDEDTEQPEYRVLVKYWNNGNIKSLIEYLGDKLHGISLGWHTNGNKYWEMTHQNDQLHGKHIVWNKDGDKSREEEYKNGELVKKIL